MNQPLERDGTLDALLGQAPVDPQSQTSPIIQRTLFLAGWIQTRAQQLQTPEERRQQSELDRIIRNPHDKSTLMQLTDQAFRARAPERVAEQLVHILDVQGVPRFFSPLERTLMRGFQSFGNYLPGVAVPLAKDKMRQETANVILPAEQDLLSTHLNQRRDSGLRMNVNFLGEALLGEEEARSRLQAYLQALQMPSIEVISVKISTLYSQVSGLAREHTTQVLCDRMELLYRAAMKERYHRRDGRQVPKLVYLDMEEYRDMHITAQVFMRTLDREGLRSALAGIALQAYLPDSFPVQQSLYRWARLRQEQGGAPVTLRLVKGANMEMERVDAALHGWPQAPFRSKRQTDANYKRMLHEALREENLRSARVGIASHNLFDVAYAMVLAWERGALQQVQFEMLEGMANPQRRAIGEAIDDLLLYAPACKRDDFIHAIGYLIRRLDENTGPENFLRHAFRIEVGSTEWNELEQDFLASFEELPNLPSQPRRIQNRRETTSRVAQRPHWIDLINEPDTDFSLPQHATWVDEICEAWEPRCDAQATNIPLVVDGTEIFDQRSVGLGGDPSRPGVVVSRFCLGESRDVQHAVNSARRDDDAWRERPADERREILDRVADRIVERRGHLIGAALADAGKLCIESDPEVSESIDFVRFYARSAESFDALANGRSAGRGVVVVVSPWNFPLAIPCGGIAAGLAAGNCVILKPSSDSVLAAYELCRCYWEAGISTRTLQFLPCPGRAAGSELVTHPAVDTVILTGGTATAEQMLGQQPDMRLLAETGGKNATIVTAMSDRDQAIKHVLHSAFGHSGQKCSATSLLILEAEVYDDPTFRDTLCDAAASRRVGSAWRPETGIGPLIRPPEGDLAHGLKELEHGESWALMPRFDAHNPHLVSPGIKWNVVPGSYTHLTEFFGPVLGVMRARNLHHAIHLANQTGFGLTSGLESLDEREWDTWRARIVAGNLYVNRPTTGAIVLRQPFGGWAKSSYGPGIKAGGPNYVSQLMRIPMEFDHNLTTQEMFNAQVSRWLQEIMRPHPHIAKVSLQERRRAIETIMNFDLRMQEEFSQARDYFQLPGQDNLFRYLPVDALRIRVAQEDDFFDILTRVAAARIVGCRVTISTPVGLDHAALRFLDSITEPDGAQVEMIEESDAQLAEAIRSKHTQRVRYAHPDRVPPCVMQAAAESGQFLAAEPIHPEGRLELLLYVREQSICIDYHRYGNLGDRGNELRAEPS